MSTSVTPPVAGTSTDTSTGIPDPRGTSTPVRTTSGTGSPTGRGTGTTGTRFAAVVLVSVVLSVAASTSVVALTGTRADAVRPQPAAVVQQDRGQGGAEQDAVEEDASTKLGEIFGGRDDSFCQSPSHPPVAC